MPPITLAPGTGSGSYRFRRRAGHESNKLRAPNAFQLLAKGGPLRTLAPAGAAPREAHLFEQNTFTDVNEGSAPLEPSVW
jgi:hypothetical protein